MPGAIVSSFLIFSFIAALTPGPNNILAFASGTRYGLRRSAPIVTGMCLGSVCVVALCGAIAFSLSSLSDHFIVLMRYVGVVYIVWLAWKVATASPESGGDGSGAGVGGFLTGFALQFANIKILVYGVTAFSTFVLPYYDSWGAIFGFTAIMSLIGNSGPLVWVLAGSALQRFLSRYARIVNAVMALLLLGCAASLLW